MDDIFLNFPGKQDLTFYASMLHWRQFAWNVKTCFLGRIKKNILICHLLKILPRVLSINNITFDLLNLNSSTWHFKSFFLAGLDGSDARPTGDQEVSGLTPARSATFFRGDLIMKYFLRSFSPFHWFKKGSYQFLAKEFAQYWLTA